MDVKVVRFDESTINKITTRENSKKLTSRKKKGKRMSGPSIKTTTLANIYEALKSVERQDDVEQYCKEDPLVAHAVGGFLKSVSNGFEDRPDTSLLSLEEIAGGLSQLRETPSNFASLDKATLNWLLKINRNCPSLATPKASSYISSTGTLATVDIDFDSTFEKAAYRIALAAAFEAAKKRSTDMTEFGNEAKKIFNTENEEYEAAFGHVVLGCEEEDSWTGTDEAATADSLIDAMAAEATSAFSKWAKKFSPATLEELFLYVFKQQTCP